MPQSIWKGAISFGLVSIPVRLFCATEEKDISFRQVHREDGGRIRYKRVCSVDGEEVAYADIAKGYELPDGEMVVLDDDDFANLPITRPAPSRSSASCRPHRSTPSRSTSPTTATPPATSSRTSSCATRWRRPTGSPSSRSPSGSASGWRCCARGTASGAADPAVAGRGARAQARHRRRRHGAAAGAGDGRVVHQGLSGDFEPDEFSDEYRGALEEVIEAKVAGHEVVAPTEEPAPRQVVDLMEAFRGSVAEAK